VKQQLMVIRTESVSPGGDS